MGAPRIARCEQKVWRSRWTPLRDHRHLRSSRVLCQDDGAPLITEPPALRNGHVTVPVGPLDRELPLGEIDVAPVERDHLAAPQARVPAQEHDQVCHRIDRLRGRDQPFVFLEVVERDGRSRHRQQRDRAGHPVDHGRA
jgi:hypothetical protein